jgi:streptomycin 6-kinase
MEISIFIFNILSSERGRLGWERKTIINWATAHAVLSAWWSIEDQEDWTYSLQCTEIFSELK